jgi:hypothetical protein
MATENVLKKKRVGWLVTSMTAVETKCSLSGPDMRAMISQYRMFTERSTSKDDNTVPDLFIALSICPLT